MASPNNKKADKTTPAIDAVTTTETVPSTETVPTPDGIDAPALDAVLAAEAPAVVETKAVPAPEATTEHVPMPVIRITNKMPKGGVSIYDTSENSYVILAGKSKTFAADAINVDNLSKLVSSGVISIEQGI